ncbi:MAG: four helix bundle protein [Patescibacteria group bacterium]
MVKKDKENNSYLSLNKLEVYTLSRSLSRISWKVYCELNWQNKKIIGDQFIRATDSVGANVAEGYGRYHYLDKIKFYYNARASLKESRHWIELIKERNLSDENNILEYFQIYQKLSPKMNAFINSCYKNKQDNELPITNSH